MKLKIFTAVITAAAVAAVSVVPAFAADTAGYADIQNGAAAVVGSVIDGEVGSGDAASGSEDIEKEHHLAYIKGYADGTVKPSKKLTRAEAVQMLHNINSENPAPSEAFYTSPQITRGEFAKLVLAAKGAAAKETSDFMTGYPDGTLGLERQLSRAEAVTMINRAYDRSADTFTVMASMDLRVMPDVTTEHWAYYELMEAITDHHAYGSDVLDDGSEEELWTDWKSGTVDLPQGWQNIDGNLFYVNNLNLFAYNTTVDGIKLDANGRYTTGNSELDSLLRAEIKKIINNDMTQDQKLRVIYDYMMENYGYRSAGTVEAGAEGWEPEFAVNMLKSGKGNCYSWAAAFTYLARQSGWAANAVSGTAVSPKGSVRDHAWIEITIDGTAYTFDPEIEGVYAKNNNESYDLFKKEYGEAVWKYNKVEIEEPDYDDDINTPVDESLVKILDQIYEGVGVVPDGLEQSQYLADAAVTASTEQYYTGTTGLKYIAGAAREPLMTSRAHSTVILKMESGADMDAAVKSIKENVDGYKWICVGVADENILVDYAGDYILLTMDDEYSHQIMDNFKKYITL